MPTVRALRHQDSWHACAAVVFHRASMNGAQTDAWQWRRYIINSYNAKVTVKFRTQINKANSTQLLKKSMIKLSFFTLKLIRTYILTGNLCKHRYIIANIRLKAFKMGIILEIFNILIILNYGRVQCVRRLLHCVPSLLQCHVCLQIAALCSLPASVPCVPADCCTVRQCHVCLHIAALCVSAMCACRLQSRVPSLLQFAAGFQVGAHDLSTETRS